MNVSPIDMLAVIECQFPEWLIGIFGIIFLKLLLQCFKRDQLITLTILKSFYLLDVVGNGDLFAENQF